MAILFIACNHPDRHLVSVKNDQAVDLGRLDEVRRHLDGFWVPEDATDNYWRDTIIWWHFDKNSKYARQYFLPYNDEIKRTETIPVHSCAIHIEPMLMNGKMYLARIGLGGSDTVQLTLLTQTRCIIGDEAYHRHKGYAFLLQK